MPTPDYFWNSYTASNTITTMPVNYYPIQNLTIRQASPYVPPVLHVVDTPEAWLRQRVKEMCELAA